MPYQQYQPTWQNPYMQQAQQQVAQAVQPAPQPYQRQGGRLYVDGPAEAMSRLITMYPAGQLVPGFISIEAWDVNGRQFHVLSVEADGRRNLETFDYFPHADERPVKVDGASFGSQHEFEEFTAKVAAALGAINGVREPVQPDEGKPVPAHAGRHSDGPSASDKEPGGR